VITWRNVTVTLDALKPWEHNPRSMSKAQAKRLIKSWDTLGQFQTIAIGPDGEVYDGHQRLNALLAAYGPQYRIEARQSAQALNDDERAALTLAANLPAGAWDWDKLAQWDAAAMQDWGFDADTLRTWNNDVANLATMLTVDTATDADAEPQIDRAAELNEKWQVKTGDLWRIGDHRLLCGDSTKREDVEWVMQGEKALVFSDAPYGVEIVQDNKVGGKNLAAVGNYSPVVGDDTTDTARTFYETCKGIGFTDFILWGGNYFTDFLAPSPCWIVWDKQNTGNFADVEMAWTSFNKSARIYRQMWNGMIREGEHEKRVHPTQKPVKIISEIMRDFESKIYFDGFAGSGTTLVACQNLQRKCRAIEIASNYCAVILERMITAFPDIVIERMES
jgi:hypothetical protein